MTSKLNSVCKISVSLKYNRTKWLIFIHLNDIPAVWRRLWNNIHTIRKEDKKLTDESSQYFRGKINDCFKVLGCTPVENKLMEWYHSAQLTEEEECPNSWCWWSAMHSALYIDSSVRNPSVRIPVQQHCEKINGVRSLKGDIQYLLWSVNLVRHGTVWHEKHGEEETGRQTGGSVLLKCAEGRF